MLHDMHDQEQLAWYSLTDELKLVIVEALIGEDLLQECHDLACAILVTLWHVEVSQVQYKFGGSLQPSFDRGLQIMITCTVVCHACCRWCRYKLRRQIHLC